MSRKKRSKKEKEVPPVEAEAPAPAPEETEGAESVEVAEAVEGADADAVPFAEDPAASENPIGESPEGPVEMSVDELLPETPMNEAVAGEAPAPESGEMSVEAAAETEAGEAQDGRHSLKKVIEAILFASQKPVSAKELIAVLKGAAEADKENPSAPTRPFAKLKEPVIQAAIEELEIECADASRAYEVRETAAGWQLVTKPDYSPWLRQLYPENRPARLSAPALETLAIIAYRQPITRADIEAVRGVAVDGVMQTLLDRGLIKIAGRAEIPGRPLLYDTTQHFMEHFGLKDLDDLPNATELRKIALPKAEVPEETPANPPEGAAATSPAAEGDAPVEAEPAPAAEPAHADFMDEAASEPEAPAEGDADGETAEILAETEELVPAEEGAADFAPGENDADTVEEPPEAPAETGDEPSPGGEESSDSPEHVGVEPEQSEP